MEVVPLPLANPQLRERVGAPALDFETRESECLQPRRLAHCFGAPRPIALWHLCSFDAPTVAVVWTLAFAWVASVRLPLWVPILLALVAWSVYIGDRLLDARAGLRSPAHHELRERHYFHWRHRRILIPVAAAAALAAAGIVLLDMPRGARTPNSLLAVAAFAYFSGVHSRHKLPRLVSKEFLVGVIFTAGCALPAALHEWSRVHPPGAPSSLCWPLWAPFAYFAALAWLNCHSIARWESGKRGPHITAVPTLGTALALAGLVLAFSCADTHPRSAVLLATGAASALFLALLDRLRSRLTPITLRAAADLVLLTPVLLLPLARLLA